MYFGNEIKLSSDKLSWELYESGWIDRSESIKKDVLIFGEFLMQPIQLTILMIYPLTLETFTRVCKYEKRLITGAGCKPDGRYFHIEICFAYLQIMNNAYSMFNILKSF